MAIFDKENGDGYNFYLQNSALHMRIVTDVSNIALETAQAVIPLNEWVFVAGTYDGSKMTIYINGEKNIDTNQTGNITINSSNPPIIGYSLNFNSREFKGINDEMLVYNRALSGQEIKDIYKKQLFGNFFLIEDPLGKYKLI